jgi:hypothetical protein
LDFSCTNNIAERSSSLGASEAKGNENKKAVLKTDS